MTTLRAQIEKLANDWIASAELTRLDKGQRTRTQSGHEVLANCGYALRDVLALLPHEETPDWITDRSLGIGLEIPPDGEYRRIGESLGLSENLLVVPAAEGIAAPPQEESVRRLITAASAMSKELWETYGDTPRVVHLFKAFDAAVAGLTAPRADAAAGWQEKVTRLEVIGPNGRIYSKWNTKLEFHVQDEGRTLKVFVKGQV
jgi:hypothetical protein